MNRKSHSNSELNQLLSEFMLRSDSLSPTDRKYAVSALKTLMAKLDGKGTIRASAAAKRSKPLVSVAELLRLAAAIEEQSTRDEGLKLLDKANLVRRELDQLAKLRSIYVSKDDTVAQVKDRIIEALIGARLSSRAIRGDPF